MRDCELCMCVSCRDMRAHAFKWVTVGSSCHSSLMHVRGEPWNVGFMFHLFFSWHFLFVRHNYIYQASWTLNFWDPPASTSPLSVSTLGFQMCCAWFYMDSEDLNSVLCVCLPGTFTTKPSISSAFSNGIAYN